MSSSPPTFASRTLVATGIVIATVVVLVLVWQAFTVLLLGLAAVLLALPLAAITDLLRRRTGMHRTVALVIVVVLLLSITAGAAVALTPIVETQVEQLGDDLPSRLETLTEKLESSWIGRQILDEVRNPRQLVVSALKPKKMAGLLYTAAGALSALVFIAAIAVYLAGEPDMYVNGVLRLVPRARRDRLREVLHEMRIVLLRWLVGQGISMLILGVLTSTMLWATGVPLAFLLGLFVALMTFIPILGPIIASVPVLLMAAAEGTSTLILVGFLYLGIQQLEGNVITPMVHRVRIALPPVLILGVQLILATLVGFVGILMAMPLVAAGMVAVQMLYVEDVLGDSFEEPAR